MDDRPDPPRPAEPPPGPADALADPRPERGVFEERIAVAAMALLVLITLTNVVTRYLSDASFAWTEEISVFLMVFLTLAGASAVARRDRHIRIEFLFNRRAADGTSVPRRNLALLAAFVSSVVFLLLALLFSRWVWDLFRYSETSMGLGVPLWWYGASIPVLCAAAAWRALAAFRAMWRGKQPRTGARIEP